MNSRWSALLEVFCHIWWRRYGSYAVLQYQQCDKRNSVGAFATVNNRGAVLVANVGQFDKTLTHTGDQIA